MRRSYLGGPQIVEKRPSRRRRCLGCDRPMLTTVSTRLCPRCTAGAAALEVGAIVEGTTVLVQIFVSEPP